MKMMRLLALILVGVLHVAAANAAGRRSIADFYGKYTGQSISDAAMGLSTRDLAVSITKHKSGFKLDWTTIIPKAGGEVSRKSYSIIFHPTGREQIFRSLMGRDLFGNQVPLDPMKGQPYVWSRIRGDTLSVFMMLVTPDGGYEMQAYHRTLTPGGMKLRFKRQREDKTLKVIDAVLTRTGN